MKRTGLALSSVEQVVDGGSESFGLLFAGEVQADLTGLRGRRHFNCLKRFSSSVEAEQSRIDEKSNVSADKPRT